MKKIGIALGGGGARGLSHIGVLRAFEEAKLPLSYLSGTSMGAIIGACYCVNPAIKPLEEAIRTFVSEKLFDAIKLDMLTDNASAPRKGLLEKARTFIIDGYLRFIEQTKTSFFGLEKLEKIISDLLPDIDISETKIPFACVATDLTNGQEKIFRSGSLRKAVMASASIAGVFPPVEISGVYFNDGGSVSVTPVRAVKKLGAEFVVAVDVKSRVMRWEKPGSAKEIMHRSNYITGSLLNQRDLLEADVVVSPAVKHIHWTGFSKIDFLITKGHKAAALKVWEIRAKNDYRSWWQTISGLFKE